MCPNFPGANYFGHERGAFTGAYSTRDGAFAIADGGTLFLDEVGDLPLLLQAQLLRVAQEHTYKRVGGNTWYETDFRLICATNKDLLKSVEEGSFRRDLYYRLTGWSFTLPPLRERADDILFLAEYFISNHNGGTHSVELDQAVREYLVKREYPGNVRDLKQVVSRILARQVDSGIITVGDIPKEEIPNPGDKEKRWYGEHFEQSIQRALSLGVSMKEIGRMAENTAVNIAMDKGKGKTVKAASILGVEPSNSPIS